MVLVIYLNTSSSTILQIVLTLCVLRDGRLNGCLIFSALPFLFRIQTMNLVDTEILILNVNEKVEMLLYCSSRFTKDQNYSILNVAINYVLETRVFDGPLLWYKTFRLIFKYMLYVTYMFLITVAYTCTYNWMFIFSSFCLFISFLILSVSHNLAQRFCI